VDRALINRIDALRIDRNVQRVPSWCVQLAVFGLALAIVVSRRPDAVSNPQFWAEDGKFWYADAYNTGGVGPLLQPYYGYLHLVPRLTALVAQALPLRRGPLLFNLVAIVIEILPVQLLVSSRLSGLGGVSTRMLFGFLCLSLPHTSETHSNITNAQWYLALLAFLVLVSAPARTWGWRSFDILAVVSSSLSGPFAFMLAPVAALVWWKRRGRKPLELLLITIGGALIQGATMLYSLTHAHYLARTPQPLGATPGLFAKILADQVFLGALVGGNGLCHTSVPWAVLVATAGMALIVYALFKGPLELKLFVGFAVLVLSASLLSPTSVGKVPAWQGLEFPQNGLRYWFLPMLAFAWTLAWLVGRGNPKGVRSVAAIVLCLMPFGIVREWRDRAFADLHFQEYAKRFEASPPGTVFTIPYNPPDGRWSMRLVKH